MHLSPAVLNLLFWGFIILSASVFFLYRIVEKRAGYAAAERLRIGQVLLFVLFFLIHGTLLMGPWDMFLYLLVSSVLSGALEMVGANTGWLTGRYRYTAASCPLPALWGVPLCYPLVWSALVYISLWLALLFQYAPGGAGLHLSAGTILAVPLLATLLDLFLDPIAVDEGRWIWERRGRYYGVPLSNFCSWLVAGLAIVLAFRFAARPVFVLPDYSPWFVFAPALLYGLLAAASARVCFERRLTLPGIVAVVTAVVELVYAVVKIGG